jgi:siroheme synthase-like protein
MMSQSNLFPIFLKLTGRTVLVVGAGSVAASKLDALEKSGATIRIVAPQIGQNIKRSGISIVHRKFQPSDLDGVWLVVAAATTEVNRQVANAAEERCVFVNAVDDPANASAYLGGVVRKGDVTFSISTNGRAPALTSILREGLEMVLPTSDLERWMKDAEILRTQWRSEGVPMNERRPLLLEALIRNYSYNKGSSGATK